MERITWDSALLTPQILLEQAHKYVRGSTILLGHANHPTVTRLYPQLLELIRERLLPPSPSTRCSARPAPTAETPFARTPAKGQGWFRRATKAEVGAPKGWRIRPSEQVPIIRRARRAICCSRGAGLSRSTVDGRAPDGGGTNGNERPQDTSAMAKIFVEPTALQRAAGHPVTTCRGSRVPINGRHLSLNAFMIVAALLFCLGYVGMVYLTVTAH